MALDDATRGLVAPYVSSLDSDVFALSGLPEEVIAVLFAYYSRSRDDLRTNLAKLLADQELDVVEAAGSARTTTELATDKARAFHEKWVVGYGHASVAEHAVVHLAIENVSILVSKAIEDLRLGSYTEKSTRYVVFDRHSFVDLPELPEELAAVYVACGARLFATYLDLMPRVVDALRAASPEGTSVAAVRSQACDLLRGLLPAGTRTNLGLTANARAMEMLLSKMLASPLAEVVRVGEAMLAAALTVTPTLVKYASPNAYRAKLPGALDGALGAVYTLPEEASSTNVMGTPVRLVRHDKDALERIVMALAYEGSDARLYASGLGDALKYATRDEVLGIVKAALADRGRFDPVPRGFEASSVTVELLLDYGAYRDMQRHRMLSPATQRLSCQLGFEIPVELTEMGFGDTYRDVMLAAHDAWQTIAATHPLEAQYVVPLGFRVRTLWTLNLRELFHVVELRSAKQGHVSYRRVAQALYHTACGAFPWLADLMRVDLGEYPLSRA